VGNRDYPVDVCCVGNGHQPGSCKIAGAAHFVIDTPRRHRRSAGSRRLIGISERRLQR
jgi:hypothetical protein